MTTNIEIINMDQFRNSGIDGKVGSLMFGDDWYDCKTYVNIKAFKKNIAPLPKGSKILRILVKTKSHLEFINIANKAIPYTSPICADRLDDGAKFITREWGSFWGVENPIGDAVIVVSKL